MYRKDVTVRTTVFSPWAYGTDRHDPNFVSSNYTIANTHCRFIETTTIDNIGEDCIWLPWARPSTTYIRKMITRHKSMCGCRICGERTACCLHYHHIDPQMKEGTISNMRSYLAIDEIRKCVVLCANCHAKVHHRLIGLPIQ